MSLLLRLTDVGLIYPVFSVNARSLRHLVLSALTGGHVLKDSRDVVYVSALQNISLELNQGDRLGIYGHNGSGKTTLLKVISGIYHPTSGSVQAFGKISSMIDMTSGLDVDATGVENIKLIGVLRGLNKAAIKEKVEEVSAFADLGAFLDLPVRTYSAGMTARLLFAVATSFDPEILVLDEWIGAGDANFLEKAERRMEEFVQKSKLLILATHSTDLIKRRCNKLLVLSGGKIAYFGDTQQYFDELHAVA